MKRIYTISAKFKVDKREDLKNRKKSTAKIKIKEIDFEDKGDYLLYKIVYNIKAKTLKKSLKILGNRLKNTSYCKCLNWEYKGMHNK